MTHLIDDLPMLPQVLVRIIQLDPESDRYFDEVEQLATEDPALAVRVIALANSAASSPAEPITSIATAMTRMGTSTVSQMLACLAVQKVFMPTEPNQINMWVHSVCTALVGRTLARLITQLGVESGTAYLTGLLHDVGRFVMFEHASPQLMAVDESNWNTPEQLIAADLAVFKYTHSELGYLACQRWGLPDLLANVIRAHHNPIPSSITPGSSDALNFVVQWADHLSIHVIDVPEEDLEDRDLAELVTECCPVQGCPEAWVPRITKHINRMRDESSALLQSLGFAAH
ncbi:MAG: HDOD domain-containing protein [Xanthomonadales bacterium]|nr:HDOD domain-containing protein [Xanthomonadales bacterium]